MEALTVIEAEELIKENKENSNFQIIDVRSINEFNSGHIENAINIPLDQIQEKIKFFDKNKKYLLYCRTQGRSQFAHQILRSQGFDTRFILGGYLDWINN